MPPPIRIMLVDTPDLCRHCLAAVLQRRRRLQVIAEAGTGHEARARARLHRPAVAVVEPEVPDGGVQLLADLCQETPDCAVLVLTSASDDAAASQALQAGARGYLRKSCTVEDLVHAIERVHAGDLVVAAALAPAVVKDLSGDGAREPDRLGLTPRELEVLQLVAKGHTNPQIARKLCITDHTVKGHLASTLAKLGLANRVQLATYATHHGLLPPPEDAVSD
ncbi:MAG: response regulator transcription factor [Chloroflexi bacterium]|nr:response regulator transcription factor [Chloroflexota bacterium]